jgi:NAD(P) transhydrogenase subunit alpha
VEHGEVRIVPGQVLINTMPGEASALYARNVAALSKLLITDGALRIDLDDEVVKGTVMTHEGHVVHPRVVPLLESAAPSAGGDA